MSYATMDHAAWAQTNINAQKSRKKRRADLTKGFDAAPEILTPFQCKVFDILGISFCGIYNAPISWNAIQWSGWGGDALFVPVYSHLATTDYNRLTNLVFLCHEARIRLEIRPHGFRYLGLAFSQRVATGGSARRHNNLDEATAALRAYLPPDHRIFYREDASAEAAE